MSAARGWVFLLLIGGLAWSQAPSGPVVNPRGVLNAFSQQPAPSAVAPGGILSIEGLNLGPPEGIIPDGFPLPTQVGEPPIQVLINDKAAPILSVRPTRILVQVPWDTPVGLATVVVRRGEATSRPARVMVNRLEPAIRTVDDKGYGEAAGRLSGNVLALSATGLGPTQPRVGDGEPGPTDPPARPREQVRAFIGGFPARVRATLSPDRPGVFDLRIEVPEEAKPGDLITLLVGTRRANLVTFGSAQQPEIEFLPIPEDAPPFRSLVTAGIRGSYAIASGARDDDGCYPSFLLDFASRRAAKIEACLTAAPAARSPVVAASDSPRLAAFLGPPVGNPPAGLSSKVIIFDPAREDPLTVELPEAAVSLLAQPGGDFAAVLPGTPARTLIIDGETGELRQPAAGGTAAGAAMPRPEVEGYPQVLFVSALPQNLFAALVTDSADKPTRARLVVLNRQGEVQGERDFPPGWVPLVAPARPQAGAQLAAQLRRIAAYFDGLKQTFYVLARRSDDSRHAIIAFTAENLKADVVELPDSWFVAACSPTIPMFTLELARKLVLLGAGAPESEIKDPCPASGFVLFDLEAQKISAIPLPGQGQFDADPATTGDVNDFIYGSNTDPSRRNMADTLFVLDGVTASAFRMTLPAGATSFANPTPLPALNAVIALASNRLAGDAGFVYFDLERAEARLLPTPEGFGQVGLVGVFTATRKLLARGIKSGGGSQYLIYDLVTGHLLMPSNPERVAWVGNVVRAAAGQAGAAQPAPGAAQPGQGQQPGPIGTPPGQVGQGPGQGFPGGQGGQGPGQGFPGGQGGQTGGATPAPGAAQPAAATPVVQQASPAANTVSALALDDKGGQLGFLLLRVP